LLADTMISRITEIAKKMGARVRWRQFCIS
jgi:hypothetical protein